MVVIPEAAEERVAKNTAAHALEQGGRCLRRQEILRVQCREVAIG